MTNVEQALHYWYLRNQSEPEPFKSFAREHIAHLLQFLLDDAERFVWRLEHPVEPAPTQAEYEQTIRTALGEACL